MFDVRFSIDRIAGTLRLELTDTSDYSGVSSVTGFYKVIYPDGVFRENTDTLNPDFTLVDNSTEITLRSIDGRLILGEYTIIQKSFRNTGYVEEQSVFTFDFVEYLPLVSNLSNTLTPIVRFGDGSLTTVPNHVLFSHTFSLSAPWPATTGLTGTRSSSNVPLQMVDSGNTYEGFYQVTIQTTTNYSKPAYTVFYRQRSIQTFDVRKALSFTEIGALINLVKDRLDSASSKSKYERLYWQVTSLYANILSNIRIGEPTVDLALEMQEVAYEIDQCCNNSEYVYSDDPLSPSPLVEYDGFLAVASEDGTIQFNSETNNVIRFRGTNSNFVTFDPLTNMITIGSNDETLYVRFDTNSQSLNGTQRQNSRTNIQALSRDTNDSRTGTLVNNGQVTINGSTGDSGLLVNANNGIRVNTGESGLASEDSFSILNNNGGGISVQRRGGMTVRSRGDGVAGYFILKLQNNNPTATDVFAVLGTNGYTEIGISSAPIASVLLNVLGKVQHLDATNPSESATLGQVNSLIAIALQDVVAGESYRGTWNANTNTPTLASSVGTQGHYYQVSVAGTTNLNGINSWALGDEVVFNGTVWTKRESFGIKTLNGKSGNIVTLNQNEVPDGTTFKQYSQTEKTKLSTIEENADVTDAQNVGAAIVSADSKTNPVSGDSIGIIDSEDSNLLKKVLLSSLALLFANNFVRYDVGTQSLTPAQRQNTSTNTWQTDGSPQVITSLGTLDVTRTSNCLIFTGVGYVRVSTINAGYNGEEICIINRTGQVLDLDSISGASPDGFLTDLGVANSAAVFLKYVTGINRWIPFVNLTRIVPSVAGGINDFPFVVYQNNGTTPILEVRSQGNVMVQGVGNAGQNNAALNVNQLASGGGGDRPIIIARRETGANAWLLRNDGRIIHYSRSGAANEAVRRDELYLNYSQEIETAGAINDLALNADTKMVSLTSVTSATLSGVTGGEQSRLLRIEARNFAKTVLNNSLLSASANRFQIGSDLVIPVGRVAEFMYLQGGWRLIGMNTLSIVSVPANSTSPGAVGQFAYDADFLYTYVGNEIDTHLWIKTIRTT